ncbi:tripeptidyl peptidase A [Coniophora puteana RWD-64-598 SS2]|uniref:tripeptidyl-peptidase II n=1 Tax=Coniophora puteana (strain RWD-64-598) TaxID=741705 RepID=A0A5M3MBL7_CONPW|nr:tripeptidyl peptidase A [Coniophora puteana RWD-64-598 SS2]EIW76284.1 tripeptidyl peptidase A [Coniophora puteana RWD-64-598 SS2]
MRSAWLTLVAAALAYAAAPSFRGCENKVKDSLHGVPQGWVQQAPAPQDQLIQLKIALAQPSAHELEKHIVEASDPAHERYGQFLSKEEAHELMAPEQGSVDIVREWLATHGLGEEHLYNSAAGDMVTIRVPVAVAESMLDTKFHVYTHAASGDSAIRTTAYSLPELLHDHVSFVQPTTMYARFKPMRSTMHFAGGVKATLAAGSVKSAAGQDVDASCNDEITLSCLQQLYNFGDYKPSTNTTLAVTGYLEEYANNADFQQFLGDDSANFTTTLVNGGKNDQDPSAAGGEANLDVQYAFGVAQPLAGTFYSTAGTPPFTPDKNEPTNGNEPYIDWLDFVLNQTSLPSVISTSYGDDEQTVPVDYAQRVCQGFQTLGSRGVSVTFSSGDSGVGDGSSDPSSTTCIANNGTNAIKFLPAFPASCPYVTTVGATQNVPEVAASFSGGGFSNIFARPSYQDDAVSAFLTGLGDTYAGLYNASGRAYPDVSAQGVNFDIVLGGSHTGVSGTSCSSPAFAGVVALVNDARVAAGKATLGFLNPLLYGAGAGAFNDITSGNNPGCGTEGFSAGTGWDPVTGLGTPDFDKLKTVALDN